MTSSTSRREIVLATNSPTSLQHELEQENFRVLAVEDCHSALQVIQGHAFDAILVAMNCEQHDDCRRRIKQTDPALQVLILSDVKQLNEPDHDPRVDIVSADEPLSKLRPMICRAVELTRLRRENLQLRQQLAAVGPTAVSGWDVNPSQAAARVGLTIGGDANLASMNRAHVVAVLAQHKGNKAQTARALGINRRSLYRLLEKYKA